MKNKDLDLKSLKPALANFGKGLQRYAGIIFFVAVAGVYGFVVFRINALNSIEPSDSDIQAQTSKTTAVPKIDPAVVEKLESLKDNSVNVKTLFDDARNNPFQE